MRLNLGCGKDVKGGWLNVDIHPGPGITHVHDLRAPLPWPDNSVDEILCSHVLEHIIEYESVIVECHRVLRPKGVLEVRAPYGIDYSPYHVRYFGPQTLDAFIRNNNWADAKTLDWTPLFDLLERRIDRKHLGEWHMQHYLGRAVRIPIGKRWQIVWRLEKVK